MAHILIVEDEEPILNSYTLVLSKKGHTVVPTSSASAALLSLQTEKFDLILLDLLMPEMSGVEFLRQFNPRTTAPGTRIVVLTNTESPKIINEAMELGASQYLLKVENTPYDIADKIPSFIK